MSVATPEQVAMARRMAAKTKCGAAPSEILAGDWDNSPLVQATLAAIIETSEAAAKLAESGVRLGFEGYDLTGFMGENNRCRALATALRNGEHLKDIDRLAGEVG